MLGFGTGLLRQSAVISIAAGVVWCVSITKRVKETLDYRRQHMNDWNGNGKHDLQDSWMDYQMAHTDLNSNSNPKQSLGADSDWWIWLLFLIVICLCPPIGILIAVIALLSN